MGFCDPPASSPMVATRSPSAPPLTFAELRPASAAHLNAAQVLISIEQAQGERRSPDLSLDKDCQYPSSFYCALLQSIRLNSRSSEQQHQRLEQAVAEIGIVKGEAGQALAKAGDVEHNVQGIVMQRIRSQIDAFGDRIVTISRTFRDRR